MSSCAAAEWRRRTSGNTCNRRLIFVDSWRGTGLGHVIIGLSNALAFALRTNRSIRIASCVPRRLAASFAPAMPACEDGRHFDALDYVHFDGIPLLQATASDWKGLRIAAVVRGQQAVFRKPSCEQLRLLAHGSSLVVVWAHLTQQQAFKCAIFDGVPPIGPALASACIRRLRPRGHLPALPPCTVGLHLRSLALDDPGCDLLRPAVDGKEPQRCRLREASHRRMYAVRARHPRCAAFPFPASIATSISTTGAPISSVCTRGDSLFATADNVALYSRHTRTLGWKDLGEAAVRTWLLNSSTERATTMATIGAWVALSRCTRAIVAPVPSKFSDSAALAAGVPVLRCCQQPWSHESARQSDAFLF